MRPSIHNRIYIAALLSLALPGSIHAYAQEVDRIAEALAEDIAGAGKKSIAVVDFTDLQGRAPELGRFLAEEFSAALAGANRGFEVVDRTHLKVILRENELAEVGLVDARTAVRLGQIAGVDAIVTGTITPFGDTVRVVVKILDGSTARLIGSARGDIAKTLGIEELLREPSVIGPGPEPRPSPTQSTQSEFTRENFTFNFRECVASGTSVTCTLTVKNVGEDRLFYIYGKHSSYGTTRLFDNLGNEYPASQARLGTNQGEGEVEKMLIRGIPITMSFVFQGVSPEASSIAVLEVAYWVTARASVKYRDILFSSQ